MRILNTVNAGSYVLSPLQVVRKASGETVALWSSSDALVLKMLTGVLETQLPLHPQSEPTASGSPDGAVPQTVGPGTDAVLTEGCLRSASK
ncbi:hypothetical protein [Enterobacter bugandensis]|uniref:hypothetical protein n=1 Tax=Enterobacter bugandensis TaxID=881260 RepID=UPI0021D105A2|nr:hypothetical protein [Enterobacter bugandensis]MCU6172424.1 hypothetical protein [Enterobacter bugandensis]